MRWTVCHGRLVYRGTRMCLTSARNTQLHIHSTKPALLSMFLNAPKACTVAFNREHEATAGAGAKWFSSQVLCSLRDNGNLLVKIKVASVTFEQAAIYCGDVVLYTMNSLKPVFASVCTACVRIGDRLITLRRLKDLEQLTTAEATISEDSDPIKTSH